MEAHITASELIISLSHLCQSSEILKVIVLLCLTSLAGGGGGHTWLYLDLFLPVFKDHSGPDLVPGIKKGSTMRKASSFLAVLSH